MFLLLSANIEGEIGSKRISGAKRMTGVLVPMQTGLCSGHGQRFINSSSTRHQRLAGTVGDSAHPDVL